MSWETSGNFIHRQARKAAILLAPLRDHCIPDGLMRYKHPPAIRYGVGEPYETPLADSAARRLSRRAKTLGSGLSAPARVESRNNFKDKRSTGNSSRNSKPQYRIKGKGGKR